MGSSDTESEEELRDLNKSKKSKKKKSKSHKKKKEKKSKKLKKSKKKTGDSASSQSEYEEKTIDNIAGKVLRDDWMQNTYELKTFSKDKEPKVKLVEEKYDPRLNARELNPHWKLNGTGLPAFKKPLDDDDEQDVDDYQKKSKTQVYGQVKSSSGWRKNQTTTSTVDTEPTVVVNVAVEDPAKKLNELSAKKIKAEIMGNTERAAELDKEIAAMKEICIKANLKKKEDEHILLTHTDSRGNVRPLGNVSNEFDAGRKKRARVDTHKDGERVRYFLDDDKYDIKQMFEREKGISAADANLQFANMTKDPKAMDDEPEVFGTSKSQKGEVDRAIKAQQKVDSCELCFDSKKCVKHLVVEYHRHFYLSLPWYVGLQTGHCLLTPIEHCIASTYLDEDSWEELKSFQRSLVQMFAAQKKDVVFYETAKNLKWRNHMRIHCVPIPSSEGEMLPFYFKKAIEESEQVWSVNKQLVSLKNKDLRRSIPKGLPYFWINFGMDSGFAHVIEDENRFPNNFAEEILGGILQLDANRWRRQRKEENVRNNVKEFTENWKKYDFCK